jgi:iron complex outermembrane receptor protein
VSFHSICRWRLQSFAFALPLLVPDCARSQASTPQILADSTLEDLMNLEVISVSRKEQKLSETGAAVFVITQDDIHRSGAANIPDVLRMAPGVNVARVDANAWAISIRGFNSRYSDKILVLIDGRSIYSSAFSGVLWDQIDVPLEDIERIEIIRGPGGTAWGANAVNGVINIITMSSAATQGGVFVAGAGSRESGSLAQYGGKAGAFGTWRAFGKYSNTDSSVNPLGGTAADGWHALHGGFRTDLEPSPRDTLMVQGDLYQTGEGQTLTTVLSDRLPAAATFNDPITLASGDLQARWSHTLQNGSETSLNVYYNHVNRYDRGFVENLNSIDIDFQHHLAAGSRNDIVWGLGYRLTDENITRGYNILWLPPQRTDSLYSAFVQDEVKLARSVWFTIGTKLEHNAYTGFEYEPSAQFAWAPNSRQTVWLSASQAVRQPSRADAGIQFDEAIVPLGGSNFGVVQITGNKTVQAEQLRDYEAGYRAQVTRRLSLDVAAFRSYYRRLETTDSRDPFFVGTPGPPHVVFPVDLGNGARARTYGGEVFGTWNVTGRWRLNPGYSLIRMNVIQNPLNPNSAAVANAGDTPRHQFQFRSTLGLRSNLDWDTSLYFAGSLSNQQIPGYTRLDTQLRWRVLESVEFSVTGQNLLTQRHTEFRDVAGVDYTQAERSLLGRVTWRF